MKKIEVSEEWCQDEPLAYLVPVPCGDDYQVFANLDQAERLAGEIDDETGGPRCKIYPLYASHPIER